MLGCKRSCARMLLAALSLVLGACQNTTGSAPAAERLQGVWRVTALNGDALSAASRAHIEFSDPPRLTGNAGCNRFFGIYEYRQGELEVDEALGASKMLCQPSVMALENRLLSYLPHSRQVHFDGKRLELRDRQGRLLIVAQKELNP